MTWRIVWRTWPLLAALAFGLAAAPTPLIRLNGEIVDAGTAERLPARIYIQGEDGSWHFPQTADKEGSAVPYRVQRGAKPRLEEMHTTLSAHPFAVELPPGKYTITVERGQEYRTLSRVVVLDHKPVHVTAKLERWIGMAERGWYSGETHVHRPLSQLPNVMLAEDLNVAMPLSYWVTEAFVPPRLGPRSLPDPGPKPIAVDATHVMYPRNTEYEIFTVAKKPHTLGAFMILNHKTIFDKGAPPLRAIAEQAHSEGALIDLDKPNWPWSVLLVPLMNVDLFELANNHNWRVGFGYSSFGEPAPDYMKVERDQNGFTQRGWIDFNFQSYYALLNCGFRLRPTAGCASGVHPVPLGFGRVYVHLEKGFSYDAWMKGLSAGRSFVTTGPMLFAHVDDKLPGHVFQQQGKKTYRVSGSVVSAQPLERIEIVVNGEVQATLTPENRLTRSRGYETALATSVAIAGSSWLVVRCFEKQVGPSLRFAHSGPFHIEVAGVPLRPRKAEIAYLVRRSAEQLARSQDLLPAEAVAEYRQALRAYEKIAERAR